MEDMYDLFAQQMCQNQAILENVTSAHTAKEKAKTDFAEKEQELLECCKQSDKAAAAAQIAWAGLEKEPAQCALLKQQCDETKVLLDENIATAIAAGAAAKVDMTCLELECCASKMATPNVNLQKVQEPATAPPVDPPPFQVEVVAIKMPSNMNATNKMDAQ